MDSQTMQANPIDVVAAARVAANVTPHFPAQEKESSSVQITISEFLNHLKTAYQVHQSVDDILQAEGMEDAIKWLKLKENRLLHASCQTCTNGTIKIPLSDFELNKRKSSQTMNNQSGASSQDLNDPLKKKLNEVISEGLLDSVLPYMITQNSIVNQKKTPSTKSLEKSSSISYSTNSNSDKSCKSKKSDYKSSHPDKNAKNAEVEIHVCDEVKNVKKTFHCNKQLLVEKMGYFAEVTLGQKLEDIDISVHCDIGIFEWLMQWVKRDSLLPEDWPQLDPQCVIPILVSAAFLQMEPLLTDCLLFCHERMNEILRTSSNLACLNDSIITRLAAMYTNTELEAIKDRKDKIQSRLFTKMIISLCEQEPESVRGHWNSLAKIFRCEKCQQLIDPTVGIKIPCTPPAMRLQPDGSIINLHNKHPLWDINKYIVKLYRGLKNWRKVYWHLWGDAHFLYCITCKRYFPCSQIGWCRYHPESPQFFTLDTQKASLPVGRYPCCGERGYRFQLLENYSGCQFRDHIVNSVDVRDVAVYTMLQTYRHLIEEEPPQLLFPERLTRLIARDPNAEKNNKFISKEIFWWEGIEIVPPRPKFGLLEAFCHRKGNCEEIEEIPTPPPTTVSEIRHSSEEDDGSLPYDRSSNSSTSNSASGSGEEECHPISKLNPKCPKQVKISKVKAKRYRKRKNNKVENKLWQHNISARSNQDIQRAFEEKTIREMSTMLSKKSNLISESYNVKPRYKANQVATGGLWTRLEAEWREAQIHTNQLHKMRNPFSKCQKSRCKF